VAGFVFNKGIFYISVIVPIFRANPREDGIGRFARSTDFCIFRRFMCEIDSQVCKCIQPSIGVASGCTGEKICLGQIYRGKL